MKKLFLISIFVLVAVTTIYSERHPYVEPQQTSTGYYDSRNPADRSKYDTYDTRIAHEPPQRYSDSASYHQSHPQQDDGDSYLDTATKMLLDQGILGLAVLAMGWLVFKLFNKLDIQRQESDKVLTGIVEKNYDMLNTTLLENINQIEL